MFLELEKSVYAIPISEPEGDTLHDEFMLDSLSKADPGKKDLIPNLLDKVVQYLIVSSTSPFQCKGNGMVKFNDLVKSVFRLSNLINITIVEGSYQS